MFIAGKTYKTRGGLNAKFTGRIDEDGDYVFMVDKLRLYKADGTHGGYSGIIIPTPEFDIIGEKEDNIVKENTTDYCDGRWHGWNGGECPVHPETMVLACFLDGVDDCTNGYMPASTYDWDCTDDCMIIAFRVIKEHREPREWWALWSPGGNLIGNFTECSAHEKNDEHYCGKGEIIHIREVIKE